MVELLPRFRQPALLLQQQAKIVMRQCQPRIRPIAPEFSQPYRLPVMPFSLLRPAELRQRQPQVVVSAQMIAL